MRFLLVLFLVTGCGSKASVTPAESSDPPVVAVGDWDKPCIVFDSENKLANQISVYFTKTEYTLEYKGYSDGSCKTKNLQIRHLHTYELVGGSNNGIQKINFTTVEMGLTLYADDDVKAAKERGDYGFDDWKKNEEKIVTGKARKNGENPLPAKDSVNYSLIKIDGNSYFDADTTTGQGKDVSDRPSQVSLIAFKKK